MRIFTSFFALIMISVCLLGCINNPFGGDDDDSLIQTNAGRREYYPFEVTDEISSYIWRNESKTLLKFNVKNIASSEICSLSCIVGAKLPDGLDDTKQADFILGSGVDPSTMVQWSSSTRILGQFPSDKVYPAEAMFTGELPQGTAFWYYFSYVDCQLGSSCDLVIGVNGIGPVLGGTFVKIDIANTGDKEVCDVSCNVSLYLSNELMESEPAKFRDGQETYTFNPDESTNATATFPGLASIRDYVIRVEPYCKLCEEEKPTGKSEVSTVSIKKGKTPEGKPSATITIKNTGSIPVENVKVSVSLWPEEALELLDAVDDILVENGRTLMPGDTAECVAVFTRRADFMNGDFIKVESIRYDEVK